MMGSNGRLRVFWDLPGFLGPRGSFESSRLIESYTTVELEFALFQVKIHPISQNNHEIHPPKLTCPLKQ